MCVAALALQLTGSCASSIDQEGEGALMLVITSDGPGVLETTQPSPAGTTQTGPPDQALTLLKLSLVIEREGNSPVTRDVKPPPQTFSITAAADDARPIHLRLVGYRPVLGGGSATEPIVVRDAIARVTAGKTLSVPMPLNWLCYGAISGAGAEVKGTCPNGQTCKAGTCGPSELTNLSDFVESEFVAGPPHCFDPAKCAASTARVDVDPTSCTFTLTGSAEQANVWIKTAPPFCTVARRLVALDANSVDGYRVNGRLVQLPPSACNAEKTSEVLVSYGCPSKMTSLPACLPAQVLGSSGSGANVPSSVRIQQGNDIGMEADGDSVYLAVGGGVGGKVNIYRRTPDSLLTDYRMDKDANSPGGSDALAIDEANVYVPLAGLGIARAPKGTMVPEPVVPTTKPVTALRVVGSQLFWAESDDTSGGLYTASKGGGGAGAVTTLVPNERIGRFVTDGMTVYFTSMDAGGAYVAACEVASCASTRRRLGPDGKAIAKNVDTRLWLAPEGLYWTFKGFDQILHCPKAGCAGPPTVVVTGQQPVSLTGTETGLMWLNDGSNQTKPNEPVSVWSCVRSRCASTIGRLDQRIGPRSGQGSEQGGDKGPANYLVHNTTALYYFFNIGVEPGIRALTLPTGCP